MIKFFVLVFWSFTATAGLKGIFDKMNFMSHATRGGAYVDQAGGYITGGSFSARGESMDQTVLSFQPPSFSSGCGGIDLFMGGISFISKEKFIATLRAIGNNAASYAYGLALQQVTPQIKAVIDNLQATMQDINNANINSCRMAAQLVGGLAPKTQASTELYCSSKGLNLGSFSDYAEAKHECQKGDKRGEVQRSEDAEFKDVLGDNYNLVWKAIKDNGFLEATLAELMMSLSGSIVVKEGRSNHMKSFATNPEFIRAVVGTAGVPTKVYQCDEPENCLNPRIIDLVIKREDTLLYKINELVQSLYEKIMKDEEPSAEEKGFINATSLPILRILAINAAFKNDSNPIAIPELVEVLAYDLLLRHIESVLDLVLEHIDELRAVQLNDTAIKELRQSMAHTHKLILGERRSLLHHFQATLALINRTQRLEEYAYNKFLSQHLEE